MARTLQLLLPPLPKARQLRPLDSRTQMITRLLADPLTMHLKISLETQSASRNGQVDGRRVPSGTLRLARYRKGHAVTNDMGMRTLGALVDKEGKCRVQQQAPLPMHLRDLFFPLAIHQTRQSSTQPVFLFTS